MGWWGIAAQDLALIEGTIQTAILADQAQRFTLKVEGRLTIGQRRIEASRRARVQLLAGAVRTSIICRHLGSIKVSKLALECVSRLSPILRFTVCGKTQNGRALAHRLQGNPPRRRMANGVSYA
jgi:hypothetical protein